MILKEGGRESAPRAAKEEMVIFLFSVIIG